jgi:hypothetical protein
MKKYVSGTQIFYLIFAFILLGTLGFGQYSGLPMLSILTGSLHSQSVHDGPDHK